MKTIEDRLRKGADDAHQAVSRLQERRLPRKDAAKRVHPGLVVAFAVAATVLVVGIPAVVLSPQPPGGDLTEPSTQTPTPVPPSSPSTSETAADEPEIPPEVTAYWALEGTLDSVGGEPGWLCPPKGNSGYISVASDDEMPSNLDVTLPGETPQQVFNRDAGPICQQSPLLVLMDFVDSNRLAASAGVAIWPQQSRWQDYCPTEDDCTFKGGPVTTPTINGQPAELHTHSQAGAHDLWWFDPNGVPLYAEASGISADQLVNLAEAIAVDVASHTADIQSEAVHGLKIVWQEPSVGNWVRGYRRALTYRLDESSVQVQTQTDKSFNPYALAARNVEVLELVDLGDTLGVWTPAHGNFLDYRTSDEVHTSIEGAPDLSTAVEIAKALNHPSS